MLYIALCLITSYGSLTCYFWKVRCCLTRCQWKRRTEGWHTVGSSSSWLSDFLLCCSRSFPHSGFRRRISVPLSSPCVADYSGFRRQRISIKLRKGTLEFPVILSENSTNSSFTRFCCYIAFRFCYSLVQCLRVNVANVDYTMA